MDKNELAGIRIREIRESDVDFIVEIEKMNLGIRRPKYRKGELQKNREGRFLGSREFGMPENMGWIHTIGVHPDYQHKGIARTLLEDYKRRFIELDVDIIYTIVSLSGNMQLPFYEKMGFRPGNRVYLELDLSKEPPKGDRLTDYDFRQVM
jgi:ribosomal protein S18 acetylase RimI-like enzyme